MYMYVYLYVYPWIFLHKYMWNYSNYLRYLFFVYLQTQPFAPEANPAPNLLFYRAQ